MESTLFTSERLEIVQHCCMEEMKSSVTPARLCTVMGKYFIKYGFCSYLRFQYHTQKYIYRMSAEDPEAPHVPQPVDFFKASKGEIEDMDDDFSEHDDRRWYFVMENIEGASPADTSYEGVAKAIQWLRDVPIPPGAGIGDLGGGYAHNRFFKDYDAPLRFESIDALERYVNKGVDHTHPYSRPSKVSFAGEKLVFTQSDMARSNFLLDKSGKVCLIDFEMVSILPESFAQFTVRAMSFQDKEFGKNVAACLNWPISPNYRSMAIVSGILLMMGSAKLGKLFNTEWLYLFAHFV
ncbi:hypothetical protein JR316_0002873 [Psilocybe cubensis]|uniref:Aminoglycoside phosphotransferase domain-containing protein n=2 Tax=Psilocybe cubensis TaxID=181762 RepID=A0A8H7Y1N6_PSICU|nr:hypothetical protein JR316_0002873 [Psilocybe cubensis]KAH9483407.1 hypothetical protein JR316_0002873 [Psilocybe cubensis]